MKKFSKDLREHASKITNYEKKKMTPLTTEEKIYHNKQKLCYICKKEFNNNDKKNYKVGIIAITRANIEVLPIKYLKKSL